LAALCLAAPADVIRLKNGKTIVADSTSENNGRIEYIIGDNTFSIPKTLVEGIDTGRGSTVPAAPPAIASVELAPPQPSVSGGTELISKVVHNGQVDVAAIKAIENEGVPERSAEANFWAAVFEARLNNLPAAERYLQASLHYRPDHPVALETYAAVLLKLERYSEALPYAERAMRASPRSAEALSVLGYAYYRNNRNRDAITAWKKSLSLRPDPRVQELAAQAERESSTEADFSEQESHHFVLHYEGAQAPDGLRRSLFNVLEAQYNKLEGDLGASPRATISVSLYTDQEFFDVTHAPAWTAALNDGKIRIPIAGLTSMTPGLSRSLRHELTHSFISQITHGHVPQWLDEGLAQLEEPLSIAYAGKTLAAVYASGNQVPLNQLEMSFLGYNTQEAAVAYAESLAAVECIRANYGMSDLARILQRLGEGASIESALRSTIHEGYAQLETEIGDYLLKKYGQ